MSRPETRQRRADLVRRAMPERFATDLSRLEARIERLARGLDAVRRVRATIEVEITGPEPERFALTIRDGKVEVSKSADASPVLRIRQSAEDWDLAVERSGAAAFGVFGLGGDDGSPTLTPERIDRLSDLGRTLELRIVNVPDRASARPWTLRVALGRASIDDAHTTFELGYADLLALRAGTTNPQHLFMAGALRIEGDMTFAMELGRAMVETG